MNFHRTNLPLHENGMQIHAWINDEKIFSKTYYSIGGGFIVDEEHFGKENESLIQVPYAFRSAEELLNQCKESGLSISTLVMANEKPCILTKKCAPISRTFGVPCVSVWNAG